MALTIKQQQQHKI